MGFAISWIAFQGTSRDQVLNLINCRDLGHIDEAMESPVCGAQLPNKWFVVWFNDYLYVSPETLTTLSKDSHLLACQIEERVMASDAYEYRNGLQLWQLSYNSESKSTETQGHLPTQYTSVAQSALAEQRLADESGTIVDYLFDVPIELCFQICGFRHDQWRYHWGEPVFTAFESLG